jgi:hypothetical protein
MSDAESI